MTVEQSSAPKRRPVAPNTPNALTLSGIGLTMVRGLPGHWRCGALGSGAYVLCRQETHLGGLITGPKWSRYGRTTWQGWVVERKEGDLDAPVPETGESNTKPIARSDLMLLYPDERYRLFWSFDRGHFMQVKEEIERGTYELGDEVGAVELEFLRLNPANVKQLDVLEYLVEKKQLSEDALDVLAKHLLRSERGYELQRTTDPKGSVATIDVTPEPLRKLYLAEFIQWYAAKATERSGAHLATLYRAKSLIEAARTGAPDATLEDEVSRKYAAQGTREREVFEAYRVYAWQCAAAKRSMRAFRDTLPTTTTQVLGAAPDLEWEANARAVREQTRTSRAGEAVHPALQPHFRTPREKLLLASVGFSLIKTYFDLYGLGVLLAEQPLEGRGSLLGPLIQDFDRQWEKKRNSELIEAGQALLAQVTWQQLLEILPQVRGRDVSAHELKQRYLDVSAACGHDWTRSLHPLSGDPAFWKHVAPGVKLLAESLKGAGKTLSGLVAERLGAYTLGFREAQDLMQTLFRHEVALSGQTVDPNVHYLERVSEKAGAPNYQVTVNVKNGVLRVTSEAQSDVNVQLQLLRKVREQLPPLGKVPENAHAYALAKEVRAHYSASLVVPIDLAELKRRHTQLPKGFALLGESLNVAYAAGNLVTTLQRDLGTSDLLLPTFDLFKGVVGVADSYKAVLNAMKPPIDPAGFLKAATGGGMTVVSTVGGLDGFIKIYKGGNILFSERGDMAYEMQQGRDARAAAQGFKGMLQIAAGAVGVLGAVPATAALAATPVGLAIAVGGLLVVAATDVVLDATQPWEDHVMAFERALDDAKREELRLRRFRVSETIDDAISALRARGLT